MEENGGKSTIREEMKSLGCQHSNSSSKGEKGKIMDGSLSFLGLLNQSTTHWMAYNRNFSPHSSGGYKFAIRTLAGPCSCEGSRVGTFLASP